MHGAARAAFGQTRAQVGDGCGIGLDRDDLFEAARQDASKQAYPGEEIPRKLSRARLIGIVADQLHQGFEQEAVDLEEAAAGDPVSLIEHAIVESGRACFGDVATGGTGAGVKRSRSRSGDQHTLGRVCLQRDGRAVQAAEDGLRPWCAEERDLDAFHRVVAEELDLGSRTKPIGYVAISGRSGQERLGCGPQDRRRDEARCNRKKFSRAVPVVSQPQRTFRVGLIAAAYLAAAAVLVVPTVALAIPWLTELHRLFTAA